MYKTAVCRLVNDGITNQKNFKRHLYPSTPKAS